MPLRNTATYLLALLRPLSLRPDLRIPTISHVDWERVRRDGYNAVVIDKDNCLVRTPGFSPFLFPLTSGRRHTHTEIPSTRQSPYVLPPGHTHAADHRVERMGQPQTRIWPGEHPRRLQLCRDTKRPGRYHRKPSSHTATQTPTLTTPSLPVRKGRIRLKGTRRTRPPPSDAETRMRSGRRHVFPGRDAVARRWKREVG